MPPLWTIMVLFGIAALLAGKAANGPTKSVVYVIACVFGMVALRDALPDETFIIVVALLVIIAMVVMIIRHQRKQRKEQQSQDPDELIDRINWHRN